MSRSLADELVKSITRDIMEGIILSVGQEGNTGIVRNGSGERFVFSSEDWMSDSPPQPGMSVDFLVDGDKAGNIYATNPVGFGQKIYQCLLKIRKREFGEKVVDFFSGGNQNKMGFYVSVVFLVSLFLPMLSIPMMGSFSMSDSGSGTLLLLLVVVSGIFFYGGARKFYLGLSVVAFTVVLISAYYELFRIFSQAGTWINIAGGAAINDFQDIFYFLEIGMFSNILLLPPLFYFAFTKKYVERENRFSSLPETLARVLGKR